VGLILSDFNMTAGSGLDLLKYVRRHPVLKKTPFIMVTGNTDSATVAAVKQAGVNNYIVKPISAVNLRTRIEQVLGKLT
jgi:two-component system chemotaxis response regulator CheY